MRLFLFLHLRIKNTALEKGIVVRSNLKGKVGKNEGWFIRTGKRGQHRKCEREESKITVGMSCKSIHISLCIHKYDYSLNEIFPLRQAILPQESHNI